MGTTTTWYRRTVWQAKGNREYTRSGYEAASSRFAEGDLDVDCSDRHFIITGGNSGIGLATATEIARRGGILHLVCRNATAMKEARSHIITTTGNDRIYQHQLDLSKPREVASWAENFLALQGRLDVLINNAGCMVHERTLDEDNIEMSFAVNILAAHLITVTLIPLLKKSKDPRVITVSSAGMLTIKLDPNDLSFEKMDPFDGRLAYSQTKRQQVVLSFCYAQRYEGIRFYCMHPGWVDTPALQKSLPQFYETMKNSLRTPLQGADTVIWLAISEAAQKYSSGLFFQDRAPTPTHLPLAWTRVGSAEEQHFMNRLNELQAKYCSPSVSHSSHNNHQTSSQGILDQENFLRYENEHSNTYLAHAEATQLERPGTKESSLTFENELPKTAHDDLYQAGQQGTQEINEIFLLSESQSSNTVNDDQAGADQQEKSPTGESSLSSEAEHFNTNHNDHNETIKQNITTEETSHAIELAKLETCQDELRKNAET